jgi:uncharacterized protein with PQ loop repeat
MMGSFVMPMLLVVANVLGTGMIVPQSLRLRRHRNTDGISSAWVGVGIAMNIWWLAYGLEQALWGLIPVSAVALGLYGYMAVQLFGVLGRSMVRQLLVGTLGLGAIPLPFLVGGGWIAAGIAIGLCYAVQFAPAALESIRSDRLSGISPTTWTMAWVEAVIWLIYGMEIGDWALTVGGTGGTVMATIILVRLTTTTKSGPMTSDPLLYVQ